MPQEKIELNSGEFVEIFSFLKKKKPEGFRVRKEQAHTCFRNFDLASSNKLERKDFQ